MSSISIETVYTALAALRAMEHSLSAERDKLQARHGLETKPSMVEYLEARITKIEYARAELEELKSELSP